MKLFKSIPLVLSFALFAFLFSSCGKKNPAKLSVMSFNIRYNNPADGINAWGNRRETVVDFLTQIQPDIIGMQEVLYGQLSYLSHSMPGYEWIGVGRDDGKKKGEYVPVFYNKGKLELVREGNFWLSETPEKAGSRSWGAHLPRIVTWGRFMHKDTGQKMFFFNTHFSHVSDSARNESAKLLMKKINLIAGDTAVILTGDLNFTSKSDGYSLIVSNENKTAIVDAMHASENPHFGGESTYNGFGTASGNRKIDYIFTGRGLKVKKHGIYKVIKNDIYISDHWPVYGIIEW